MGAMNEHELAKEDVRRVVGNAGDAIGNAEAAQYLLEHDDIAGAAEKLAFVKEQAEKAAALAARAEYRLRRFVALRSAAEPQ